MAGGANVAIMRTDGAKRRSRSELGKTDLMSAGGEQVTGVAERVPRVLVLLATARRRGAEIQGSQLAQALSARGVATSVAALQGAEAPSLDVRVVGDDARSARTYARLRSYAKAVDLVIAYGSTTLPACAITLAGSGTPFVYRSIGDPDEWVRGNVHRVRTGMLYRRAARVVPLFQRSADSIERLYGVPRDRVTVIPNARDPTLYSVPTEAQRSAARRRFGVQGSDIVIAMAGSLSAEKDVRSAIDAMESFSGATLLIAGEGPLRSELEARARSLPDGRVRFLGQLESSVELFQAADVLLLTSKTEGMPGVVLESALCGIPSVATDVGAVRDVIVHGETGHVLADVNPSSIVAAIRSTAARRVEMGHAAEAFVTSRFTWGSTINLWMSVVRSAVRG